MRMQQRWRARCTFLYIVIKLFHFMVWKIFDLQKYRYLYVVFFFFRSFPEHRRLDGDRVYIEKFIIKKGFLFHIICAVEC